MGGIGAHIAKKGSSYLRRITKLPRKGTIIPTL